ncbi:P-loop containing nucleoside triphosphate hydrolase protein [Hygrophoropsis aurantiaca]|uniref:P-loop containing nucleoside triphosphate hydrolase protein n=1 Tax=Hygrophoropsis aurantiaca TaxID=72124 RepID=A0ACB8APQ8_9AGAM|nr:P-loop containing nucleoside triphosphate hydrolase protein [Hygrophoropsis aurantiaca]
MTPIHTPDLKQTRNIVVFGETGVGKSSLINLIAQDDIAKTSSGAGGCTLDARDYLTFVDPYIFRVFDTVGLNEPQIGSKGYLDAIEKAYRLVTSLTNAGGIHLLLFVIRGGRITETMQQNYRLFYEFLCHKKVPIALIITNLEHQERMEDWWDSNCDHFERFGINTVAHLCITGTRGIQDIYLNKYNESVIAVRQLLMNYGSGSAFSMEKTTWVVRVLKNLRRLVNSRNVNSRGNEKEMTRALTKRCGVGKAEAGELVRRIVRVDSDEESIFTNDTLLGRFVPKYLDL